MRSMPAVNRSFLRMSATWKALRIVESIGLADHAGVARTHGRAILALDDGAGAADALDALACGLAEAVGVNRERLAQLPLCQHLHRHTLARSQTIGLHQLDGDLGACLEASLEVRDIHWLGVSAEHLKGHRLLHVRTAQLSHAHVDRHLSALEASATLGARA